jgi:hypothetical protein
MAGMACSSGSSKGRLVGWVLFYFLLVLIIGALVNQGCYGVPCQFQLGVFVAWRDGT